MAHSLFLSKLTVDLYSSARFNQRSFYSNLKPVRNLAWLARLALIACPHNHFTTVPVFTVKESKQIADSASPLVFVFFLVIIFKEQV